MNKSEYINTIKMNNLIMSVHLQYVINKINFKEKISRRRIQEIEKFLEEEEALLKINI